MPKTRVVLFEAAVAAANGLTFDEALAAITIDAARLLGIDKRVGSLETGKDGDLALYDGDPVRVHVPLHRRRHPGRGRERGRELSP